MSLVKFGTFSALDTRRFVVVEGVDGAGKSEQSQRLLAALKERGIDTLWTREPGGCDTGKQLREILLHSDLDPISQAMLMFADRREHLRTVIAPALSEGKLVICDRFCDSSFAYQGGGHGVSMDFLTTLEDQCCENLRPGLTFFYDVPQSVSRERLAKTGKVPDAFEAQPDSFFERARAVYHQRANSRPTARVIDASGTLDEVAATSWAIMEGHLLSLQADGVPTKTRRPGR